MGRVLTRLNQLKDVQPFVGADDGKALVWNQAAGKFLPGSAAGVPDHIALAGGSVTIDSTAGAIDIRPNLALGGVASAYGGFYIWAMDAENDGGLTLQGGISGVSYSIDVNGAAIFSAVTIGASTIKSGAFLRADNSPNNLPVLDGSGLLSSTVLPPLAINETFVVASQAAMLALVAQKGDAAVRTDINKTFFLSTNNPGTLADWIEMRAAGQVLSVNGYTGTVSLATADIVGLAAALAAKQDTATAVTSVAGRTGAVTLATADITGLAGALAGKIDTTARDAANGVAGLDASGRLNAPPRIDVFADANRFVTSGSGTSADPWIFDTNAVAAVADYTCLEFRRGGHYATTNTAGLNFPVNKEFLMIRGNNATLWNRAATTSQCVLSFGGWNADGSALGSDTNCDFQAHVEHLILNGGSNGATYGLRVNSGHYSRFHHLEIRNTKTAAVRCLGGTYTTFWWCNVGYQPIAGKWTEYFHPKNGFIVDYAPDALNNPVWPCSNLRIQQCETHGTTGDGIRILAAFDWVIEQTATEVINSPDVYAGDNSWASIEAWQQANHGVGIYVGGYSSNGVIRCCDPEYAGDMPNGSGYKMGIAIDNGAVGTLIESCATFNAWVSILAGANYTTIINGDHGVKANGNGIVIQGGRATASVTRGPNVKNLYLIGGTYADGKFDILPPATVGGWVVGYDYYNNPGPVESQQFAMLYHKGVASPYPNYAVMQDAGGTTRISGTNIWIGVGDAAVITIAPANTVTASSAWVFSSNVTINGRLIGVTEKLVSVVFDNGTNVLDTTGNPFKFTVPYNCTIVGWTLLAEQSGNMTVEIDKSTYASFPTVASIVASAKPSLSSAQKNTDTVLTGWTKTLTAGDVLKFYLSGTPASIKNATLTLWVVRS